MRMILRDEDDEVVEDVEDFVEKSAGSNKKMGDQDFEFEDGDDILLGYAINQEMNIDSVIQHMGEEKGMEFEKAVCYTLINNARGDNKTISEELQDFQKYYFKTWEAAKAALDSGKELTGNLKEVVDWCMTYQCTSVTNEEGEPMDPIKSRGQSGHEQCYQRPKCWWYENTKSWPGNSEDMYLCKMNYSE